MKVALLTHQLKGVSETWIWQQIEYLHPHLACICTQGANELSNYKSVPIYNLHQLPSKVERLKNKLKGVPFDYYKNTLQNLEKIDKSKEIDTYYIHFLTQAYQLREVLLKTKKQIFIHCHGYDVTWNLKKLDYPFGKFHPEDYLDFALNIQEKATFIANSNHTRNNLITIGILPENIVILNFGVKLPKPYEIIQPNRQKKFKFLFIGRLIDCKGPHLTIKAFEKACDMGMHAELIIAGDGPLMTTCRLIKNLSNYSSSITILGPISLEEGNKLRQECQVFTAHNMTGELSNQVEAYGVALIEAMAYGLPVVTGRSGGTTETVIDGITGCLFEPGDINKHAELLFELYSNTAKFATLSKNSIQYAQENFTKEQEAIRLKKILNIKD
jgi:glycosyltransferase involved in cell wall biosynthesis